MVLGFVLSDPYLGELLADHAFLAVVIANRDCHLINYETEKVAELTRYWLGACGCDLFGKSNPAESGHPVSGRGNIIINGQVDSPFKQISHGYEGIIYITHINGQPLRFFDRPRIRLIAPILLTQNDVFAGWVNIKPIYGLLNQAGFDSETFALSQQVLARATLDPQHSWRVTSAYSVRLALIEKVSCNWRRHRTQLC